MRPFITEESAQQASTPPSPLTEGSLPCVSPQISVSAAQKRLTSSVQFQKAHTVDAVAAVSTPLAGVTVSASKQASSVFVKPAVAPLLLDEAEAAFQVHELPPSESIEAAAPVFLRVSEHSTDYRQKRKERDILAQQLWASYMQQPQNKRIREQLVLHFLPLVKQTVARLPVVLPASLCPDDLIGFGTIGLLEAIERFEPKRGYKFESFAMTRIRGEIIDQLRRHDWVPRGVRRRNKLLVQTMQELELELERNPAVEEIAERMGLSVAKVNALMDESTTLVISLDEQAFDDKEGGGSSIVDTVADNGDSDPMQQVIDGHDRQRLAQAIHGLPEREKLLIALYYQENMTLREIGDIISVSESRVCQLHAQAITRLRTRLKELS